jgi:hypothetical protein
VAHQYYLEKIGGHRCGWHIIMFEERDTPSASEEIFEVIAHLKI